MPRERMEGIILFIINKDIRMKTIMTIIVTVFMVIIGGKDESEIISQSNQFHNTVLSLHHHDI